jgi:hypothetical protein
MPSFLSASTGGHLPLPDAQLDTRIFFHYAHRQIFFWLAYTFIKYIFNIILSSHGTAGIYSFQESVPP